MNSSTSSSSPDIFDLRLLTEIVSRSMSSSSSSTDVTPASCSSRCHGNRNAHHWRKIALKWQGITTHCYFPLLLFGIIFSPLSLFGFIFSLLLLFGIIFSSLFGFIFGSLFGIIFGSLLLFGIIFRFIICLYYRQSILISTKPRAFRNPSLWVWLPAKHPYRGLEHSNNAVTHCGRVRSSLPAWSVLPYPKVGSTSE